VVTADYLVPGAAYSDASSMGMWFEFNIFFISLYELPF